MDWTSVTQDKILQLAYVNTGVMLRGRCGAWHIAELPGGCQTLHRIRFWAYNQFKINEISNLQSELICEVSSFPPQPRIFVNREHKKPYSLWRGDSLWNYPPLCAAVHGALLCEAKVMLTLRRETPKLRASQKSHQQHEHLACRCLRTGSQKITNRVL